MSTEMFCGDEVSSIIADIGGGYCKFGAGGQDSPRYVFSSEKGCIQANLETDRKCVVGDLSLNIVRNDMDIQRPFVNDCIDWEHVELLFQHGIENCMRIDPTTYPLLLSESHFSSLKSKEKLFELFFERFTLPSAYIAQSGTLSSIAAGRPTSLVIDFGAYQTRIMPVIDGYVLNKAVISTQRGGDWVDQALHKELIFSIQQQSRTPSLPFHLCPGFCYRNQSFVQTDVRASLFNFHKVNLLRDVKAHFCCVPTEPVTEANRGDHLQLPLSIPPYELPDGTIVTSSDKLCFAPEQVFFASYSSSSSAGTSGGVGTSSGMPSVSMASRLRSRLDLLPQNPAPAHALAIDVNTDSDSLSELVYAAVSRCDVDVRRDLLSNILVVGGGGLIQGVPARLTHELTELMPSNIKVKVCPMLPIERRFSSWIGGSVLSICGTFQQMWVSREQYAEHGVNLLM